MTTHANMSIFDKYDIEDVCTSTHSETMPDSGLIIVVGSSGSGKTTLLESWGMSESLPDIDTPITELFDTPDQAEKYLIAAGFRSVPAWKRTLSTISNGERHRAEIALMLSRGELFIDEFTSVVDRDTARALCHSINSLKVDRLVISTCHRDVLNWLDVDHCFDCDSGQWLDRGSLWRDRQLNLSIEPCDTEKVWEVFKKHHYLSGKINKSANSWIGIYNGKPIAMVSVIAFPNGNWTNGWREHRTVVLPEFQGMGIGSAISDEIARHIVCDEGGRYFSKTSHPAFGTHRNKSSLWVGTSKNGRSRKDYKTSSTVTKEDGHKMKHASRVCYSHEYIGVKYPIEPYPKRDDSK